MRVVNSGCDGDSRGQHSDQWCLTLKYPEWAAAEGQAELGTGDPVSLDRISVSSIISINGIGVGRESNPHRSD